MLPPSTMSLLMFLMVQGWLRPGWDWLVARKLSSFWREIDGSPLEADLARFCDTAVSVGFAEIQTKRAASQSVGRLLIQTGRPLDQLTVADLDGLAAACRAREAATGQGWRHYRPRSCAPTRSCSISASSTSRQNRPSDRTASRHGWPTATRTCAPRSLPTSSESSAPAGPRPSQALRPGSLTSAGSSPKPTPNSPRWPDCGASATSNPT